MGFRTKRTKGKIERTSGNLNNLKCAHGPLPTRSLQKKNFGWEIFIKYITFYAEFNELCLNKISHRIRNPKIQNTNSI